MEYTNKLFGAFASVSMQPVNLSRVWNWPGHRSADCPPARGGSQAEGAVDRGATFYFTL